MTKFSGLDLIEPIQRAVASEGYDKPTPIQAQAIPHLLQGRDLLGVAQTGTGKTAAFSLPLLQTLSAAKVKAGPGLPLALILAPTRELAGQIGDCIKAYGQNLGLRHLVVFGGVNIKPQIQALSRGVDILVATPGRLMDLMNQKHVRLDNVGIFVLDEADRMLDMGFIRDVRKVAERLPKQRQTVMFSATMPDTVHKLAQGLLHEPVRVEVTPAATTAERIEQRVLFVAKDNKRALLTELLNNDDIRRVLIFTRTKHGADRVAQHLTRKGIYVGAIHGNKAQNARQAALQGFRAGRLRALVATDIAARGIDVDDVTHVINFDLPNEPESYVHRIGRTARAGAGGMAISFCAADEWDYLRQIERTTRQDITVMADHPYHCDEIASGRAAEPPPTRGGGQGRGNGQPRGKGQGQGNGKRRAGNGNRRAARAA